MDRKQYEQRFEAECYHPAAEHLVENTINKLEKEIKKDYEMLFAYFRAFFSSIDQCQQTRKFGALSAMTISFLRTSLFLGKPTLLLEVYEGEELWLGNPVAAMEIPAQWMFEDWAVFQEEMERRGKEQELSHIIRAPYRKHYESQAVMLVLTMVFPNLKYMLRMLEDLESFQKIQKEEEFPITFGEYRDWQLPVFVQKPLIDLFLCDEDEDLTFRHFTQMWYEDKVFLNWNLDDCVFERCTFRHVIFRGTKLRDVRFLECVWEDCAFEDVEWMGTSVLSCHLNGVKFENCSFNGFAIDELKPKRLYAPVSFKWSLFEHVTQKNSGLTERYLEKCQLFDSLEEAQEEGEEKNEVFGADTGSGNDRSDSTETL